MNNKQWGAPIGNRSSILENHICRFNDAPQRCECFIAGVNSILEEIEGEIKDVDLMDNYSDEEIKLAQEIFGGLKTPEYMIERRHGTNLANKNFREILNKHKI